MSRAPEAYAFLHDIEVERTDPIRHPLIKGAHASPDGLVGSRGLVEIKCPQPAAHLETLLSEKIDRDYFVQIQWQLTVTGRSRCDYISCCPDFPEAMQYWEQRVDRDMPLIVELEGEVRTFLAELEEKVTALDARYPEAV